MKELLVDESGNLFCQLSCCNVRCIVLSSLSLKLYVTCESSKFVTPHLTTHIPICSLLDILRNIFLILLVSLPHLTLQLLTIDRLIFLLVKYTCLPVIYVTHTFTHFKVCGFWGGRNDQFENLPSRFKHEWRQERFRWTGRYTGWWK